MAEGTAAERAARSLHDLGYRLTPQRILILEAVLESEDHVTAEDLFELVKRRYPHISLSTVYRTMELLRDAGFVTQTDLGGGHWQYHPLEKATHHHLICQSCGTVAEVEQNVFDSLQTELSSRYKFDATLTHFAIFGRCHECRSGKSH
jgi:Fur family ferric uptake transcriptional regulator